MTANEKKAVIESLQRCAFLLFKIDSGDPKASDNALDAAEEAARVLRAVGAEEEWFEQVIVD